ncbi:MAG: hypothetical protein ACPIOQ_23655 [Promethearchaeia archaeon]
MQFLAAFHTHTHTRGMRDKRDLAVRGRRDISAAATLATYRHVKSATPAEDGSVRLPGTPLATASMAHPVSAGRQASRQVAQHQRLRFSPECLDDEVEAEIPQARPILPGLPLAGDVPSLESIQHLTPEASGHVTLTRRGALPGQMVRHID